MKKYLRLACTVCRREIDKLVDLTHYTPDQCTITLGCEGRLQLLEYRSSAGIAVAPQIGVTDWRPRGSTTIQNPDTTEPALLNLETGSLNQLVIGVPGDEPQDGSIYDLLLTVKADTPKTYRQYIFRHESAFSSISGIESGLKKQVLRFNVTGSTPDIVEVYINGVKRERGTDPEDFQVYDGPSSAIPPNTIVFNSPIDQTGVVQTDIIISKEQTSTTVSITFKRNKSDESRLALGAYENVSYVERFINGNWRRYWLYTWDVDDVSIPLNSIMIATNVSDVIFLLARQPYSRLDRYTDIVLPVQDMSVERDYIKFYAEAGETIMATTSTAIIPIYPPLRVGKFNVEKTIRTANRGVQEQLVISSHVITGPDA